MKKPYEVIEINKITGQMEPPRLLLMNRSFSVIGMIGSYENWNISLVANGMDEISFQVHKSIDGRECPIWDELVDLKIVDVAEFGRFEISVNYTDNTQTVKSVHGVSLETELAQIRLYDFHVNDEEAADMELTEWSGDNYDEKGNFIPTVFYNPQDTKHSLLHRVLADKAPHWSIGYVTPFIALEENGRFESCSAFQRTYTADGESIYDFLTGTVASESNVAFVFDTRGRRIHCYSLCDCIDPQTGKVMLDEDGEELRGIGEDTTVFVSKVRLAKEIQIVSRKDNVKNCFRVRGGDDVITDLVHAVNMNGSNYIYRFADFQYNDMSKELRDKIISYQTLMASEEVHEEYYGENGIYTRLCRAYDELSWYESSMMPDTEKLTEPGKAKAQYERVFAALNMPDGAAVAVASMENYDDRLFAGVTNNIEAYAKVFLDPRFDLEIVPSTASYEYNPKEGAEGKDGGTGVWQGKIRVTQHSDETNVYPLDMAAEQYLRVAVNGDEETFARQKLHKAMSEASMADIDFRVSAMSEQEMRDYFGQFALNRLQSFSDGYHACISILTTRGMASTEEQKHELYDAYLKRQKIVDEVKALRKAQTDETRARIESIKKEQNIFQYGDETHVGHDFRTYLGEALYLEFCSYRREDTYTNSNYISDGLSTSECLKKARELVEAADKELGRACVLQRTVSTSLLNLFALPEFEPLYDKFALFNYIRVGTEDEVLKLRLIGIEFNGETAGDIQVTFSEQVESVDGSMSDLQSIIKQAGNMASSYPATILQAKKGETAQNTFLDIYRNGLNAARTMLTNNDSNEVTVTQSGILCRRMDDEGFYGEKQFRVTGNIMAFTDDDWKTVTLAVGETTLYNPIAQKYEKKYGVLAPALVGELIAGKALHIGNEDGSVQITGSGIKITKGDITWGKGENGVAAPEIKDIEGLSGFLEQLDGRIQTYVQKNDPKKTNGTGWEDKDNANHLGDVWMNTENGIVYVFIKETDQNYKWQETQDSNLRQLAQKKAQFFTSKSTLLLEGYTVGDLWILEKDDVLKDYKRGKILVAAKSARPNEFQEEHWKETTVNEAAEAVSMTENFKKDVRSALGVDATIIGKNSIISPKIGGGYGCWMNDDYMVEIDPKHESKDTYNQYIFCVRDKKLNGEDSVIMGVKTNGDGFFKGTLSGATGTFSGELSAATGTFSGDLTSSRIYLNAGSEENRGCILVTTLTERDNLSYKGVSFINDYGSDTDNLSVSLGFRNKNDPNGSTTGFATVKKAGKIYNRLYVNTYISDNSYIGFSSSPYDGAYISNALKTPRVFAGNYVHGDYVLDVNGTSYFANNIFTQGAIFFQNDFYLNPLIEGGIYCSGKFNTEGAVSIGNQNPGFHMLHVNGTGNFNGDLYCNSPVKGSMVHMFVQNGQHTGALAINGDNFGLFDTTYEQWLIHVNANGKVTTASSLSDQRLKSGIKESSVHDALQQILAINHREFTLDYNNEYKDIGYIAQELMEINPKMVIEPDDKKDYYHIDTFYLESIITKAMQEFYSEFENSLKRISQLEQENKRLKEMMKNKS